MMLCAWQTWLECQRVLAATAQGLPIDPPAYHFNNWSIFHHSCVPRKELITRVNQIPGINLDVGHHWVLATIAKFPRSKDFPFDTSAYHSNNSIWGLNQIPNYLGDHCPAPSALGLPALMLLLIIPPLSLLFQLLQRSMINQNVSNIFSRQNNQWALLAWFSNSARFNWLKHKGVVSLSGIQCHPPLTQYDKASYSQTKS